MRWEPNDLARLEKRMSRLDESWVDAMRKGDHARAWAITDTLASGRSPATRDNPNLPYHSRWVWDGRPLDGCDVLVRCYHGLGDTIQFLRFLPILRERAASVTLEIQPRLIPLLPDDLLADRIVPFDLAHPLKPAERDVEIMELSHALRVRPDQAPPPYLRPAPAILPRGTVGICRTVGDWDTARSIPADLLRPLCEGRPCITLDTEPTPLPVLNPGGCPFDMAVTAGLVAASALVVTVDTMIAHLAGAMGKPAWVLLKHEPDWRWCPKTGRSDWYPSLRLFAQPAPGDWESVAERVAADLNAIVPQQENV